jgi:hypothetical protein
MAMQERSFPVAIRDGQDLFLWLGLNLAKNVFQVHKIDEAGEPKLKRKLRRSEVLPLFGRSSSRAGEVRRLAAPMVAASSYNTLL